MTRSRLAALAATGLATILALASCSTAPTAPVARQAEVPVLWVSVSDDGTQTGGVSHAQVSVDLTGSTASYRVEASGSGGADTGDSWDAAAAMAAAVAVLYSGQDPRGVTTTFRVSDAIDGSSAGAVLTVAALAALRGATIDPTVAMTGTIGPDGSVGHVDGIDAKVRAAAAAGYTRVLVPAASVNAAATDDETGSASASATTTTLASELGISVEPVRDVGQAMLAFTGQSIAPPDSEAPELSDPAQDEVTRQVADAIDTVSTRLAAQGAALPAATRAAITADLARATDYRDAGDQAGAYASAVGTLILLDQALATESTTTATEQDLEAANTAVINQASTLAADALTALEAQSGAPASPDPVRRYADISAASWLTDTIAVMRALIGELEALNGEVADSVIEAATVVAQYRVSVDVVYPDSLAIAHLAERSDQASDADVTSFIAAYADLLGAAGAANQAYYEGVLTSIAANPDLTFSQPGHLYAAVQQAQALLAPTTATPTSATPTLATAASATPTLATAASSTAASPQMSGDARCAWAITYFLLSSYLVADEQTYGLSGTGIGSLEISANRPEAMRVSFGSARDTAAAFDARLAQAGVAVDHPTWTAGWAAALPAAFDGQPQETGLTALGLRVLWDADVEAFLNTASLDARERPKES